MKITNALLDDLTEVFKRHFDTPEDLRAARLGAELFPEEVTDELVLEFKKHIEGQRALKKSGNGKGCIRN